MLSNHRATSHYRSWKVKPYSVSMETRMAQARASQDQPPMRSLHGKSAALPQFDNDVLNHERRR